MARVARDAARESARIADQDATQRRAVLQDIVARRARARAEAEAPEPAMVDHGAVLAAARAMDQVAQALAPCGDALDQRARELAGTLAELGTALQQAQQAVEAAERAGNGAAEADRAAEIAVAVAAERAREAGVAEDAPAPPPPVEGEEDADTIAERVEALAVRREGMGAVNPLAAEERAELSEREAETTEQIEDLEKAAEALRAQMAELDAQVAGGFADVMQAVDERFQEVVALLFPGGTGRLRIVDDEGEEGVEVEVIPAGKRARSLALFSGGEKSMIALGFCLAIAMARPTPFYLLDEVEAALDDANLRRFLGVLRRLAGERQFILITHQQPTVEVADLLFGVTMGRSGVSQVVARRLDRDAEGPARPWVRRQLQAVGSPAPVVAPEADVPPAAAAAG
jgi:chromosome segregation protein